MCRAFFSLFLLINAGLFANNLSSCPGQPRQKHKTKQKQHMPSFQLSANPIYIVSGLLEVDCLDCTLSLQSFSVFFLQPGQQSLLLLLCVFFFKTPEISFRFLTASKAQELYRRAPSVSSELSKTKKEIMNLSKTFHYFQNISHHLSLNYISNK